MLARDRVSLIRRGARARGAGAGIRGLSPASSRGGADRCPTHCRDRWRAFSSGAMAVPGASDARDAEAAGAAPRGAGTEGMGGTPGIMSLLVGEDAVRVPGKHGYHASMGARMPRTATRRSLHGLAACRIARLSVMCWCGRQPGGRLRCPRPQECCAEAYPKSATARRTASRAGRDVPRAWGRPSIRSLPRRRPPAVRWVVVVLTSAAA